MHMTKIRMAVFPFQRERIRQSFLFRKWKKLLTLIVCVTLLFLVIPKDNFLKITFHLRHISAFRMTSDIAEDEARLDKVKVTMYRPISVEYNLANAGQDDFSRGQSRLVDKLLGGMENGFFLDLGAGDGETNSVSLFFERERHWEGVLVEADEEQYKQLVKKNRRAILWNVRLRLDGDSRKLTSLSEVEVEPQEFFRLINRQHIDLLIVSLHGGEFELIKSIDFKNYTIKIISLELRDHGNADNYVQIAEYLQARGFYLAHQLLDGLMGRRDVVFNKL
ncbi:unnamed protein product [Lymnaea stagnalis]|uniref:Methyltransferase domain-containing protein n=1 Tax=Lymnaea stagnalis TaxID=6523 RepID=A0AAV2ICU5_LYMST